MLSVRCGKSIFFLILIVFIIGCLGAENTSDGGNTTEALIDAARLKIIVANQYVIEKKKDRAVETLEDASVDIIKALFLLNKTNNREVVKHVENAAGNLSIAVNSVKSGKWEKSSIPIEESEKSLLKAGVLLLDVIDSGNPARFTVQIKEMPLTYYGTVDGVYLGYQTVPHTIASEARESFYLYQKTDEAEYLDKGVFLTEYLISTASARGEGKYVVWENGFVWPVYNLSSGWIGSLSQAGCIKALMLSYLATGDERYKDFAEKAIAAFEVDVSEGGLRTTRVDGTTDYVWYPEYAKKNPPFVLNGFITAVIWLGEYYQETGNMEAKILYEDGLKSIKHFLPTYNYGDNWSYYDGGGNKASNHYHQLHIKQMETLYELTGDELFLEYMDKWSRGME